MPRLVEVDPKTWENLGNREFEVPSGGYVSIGRGVGNEILVPFSENYHDNDSVMRVSRSHGRIERCSGDDHAYVLIDLGVLMVLR